MHIIVASSFKNGLILVERTRLNGGWGSDPLHWRLYRSPHAVTIRLTAWMCCAIHAILIYSFALPCITARIVVQLLKGMTFLRPFIRVKSVARCHYLIKIALVEIRSTRRFSQGVFRL